MKSDEISLSPRVNNYPINGSKNDVDQWSASVAGFCNGAQTPKSGDIWTTTRIGISCFIYGEVVFTENMPLTLPSTPRLPAFLSAMSSDGTVVGIKISAGSKDLDVSNLVTGTHYTINGNYLVKTKGIQ